MESLSSVGRNCEFQETNSRIVNQYYIRSCPGGADLHRKCGRRRVRGSPQANISIEFYRRRHLLMDTGEKEVQDRVVTPCVPALDKSFLTPIQYMCRSKVRGVTEWTFTTDSVVPTSEVERSWKTICTSPDEK